VTPVSNQLFFIGTYTQPILFGTGEVMQGRGEGVYLVEMDGESGWLRAKALFSGIANPSYLALSPNGRYLYTTNELKDETGLDGGLVSAYAVDAGEPTLRHLSTKPTEGADPCHVVVSPQGRHIIVSNYMSGSVCVYPVLADGSLGEECQLVQHSGSGPNPGRQGGPHAHSAVFDPDGKFLLVSDLGIDQVFVYRLDGNTGRLCPVHIYRTQPGAGPRYCEFHPTLPICYLINELASSISALDYNLQTGCLTHRQTLSTLPQGDNGMNNICADLHITSDGKYVYGSNRGRDSIAIFRLDERGWMNLVGQVSSGGRTPRNFVIAPGERFLIVANQDSDNLVTFRIDKKTGSLKKQAEFVLPSPVCVRPIIKREE